MRLARMLPKGTVYAVDTEPDMVKHLAERAKLINPSKATDFGHGTPPRGGTILLTAADESGMMVSLIQSNYLGFGSGIVIPGTGISVQDRGACFTLEKGHPNQVGGGKRPYHTIIPGMVARDGRPFTTGVMRMITRSLASMSDSDPNVLTPIV